jgi:copper chaperone CopZ
VTRSATTTATHTIAGMTCGHCVQAVGDELRKLDGVVSVEVDLAGGRAVIESTRALATDEVAAAINDAGYELTS